ncbi:MAG TPA: hypothetical protein VFZ09_34310 [Archangium sp.]|jgi:hypothetical protein|uniref:hypothetical protein n=1 Tax=Archangium sp. TaxID=1872627 RepID=UPI002E330F7E|nr:hypothetical protein [Archangium sp.]HEX5751349.1 hypothetical protein [Archangium sp.]
MILAQLVNLVVNPAIPSGSAVEQARNFVQGAMEQSVSRVQYLEQKVQEIPAVAGIVDMLK